MPWETLVVNLLGCLIIGFLSAIVETDRVFSPETRSFIFVGILGAFTTFSTFSGETMNLLRSKDNHWAFMNIALHLILGLGGVWAGCILAGMIRG